MTDNFSWKEFRPAIFFVVKFLGTYLIGNLLYGFYVTSFEPQADSITVIVTRQVAAILNLITHGVSMRIHQTKPMVVLSHTSPVLGVFEGCNGINVMIVFFSFLVAFGSLHKRLLWFLPLGLLAIYISNLLRIILLFFVAKYHPHQLYFAHKYFFTAFIYLLIFVLWFWWIKITRKESA
jgi:exosortase family protein XrtF